jgi:hypothetical protein
MTQRIRIIIAAAVIALPLGLILIQRQIARTPAQPPVPMYLPIHMVSKEVSVEPDLERRKREQFEETSRFFDSPGLSEGSGIFGGR